MDYFVLACIITIVIARTARKIKLAKERGEI